MSGDRRDVVIVGAGPAGVAAAVQLSRYGVRATVFERAAVGGLLRTAWRVENHPGFPRGITGPQLAEITREHLQRSGTEVLFDEVCALEAEGREFHVGTRRGDFRAGLVIVSSGTRPLGLDGLDVSDTIRERIRYESRELWGRRGESMAIVGGGDAAFDYALGLSEHNDVTVLVRGESPVALPVLVSRPSERPRARVRTGVRVRSVTPSGGRLELAMAGAPGQAGGMSLETFDHLLVAVGREPETSFIGASVREREQELVDAGLLMFAGDVRSGIFRQSSIAAGSGTLAGMRAAMELEPRPSRTRDARHTERR